MNRSLKANEHLQPGTFQNETKSIPVVLNLLRLVKADNNQALEFSKAFKIDEFQLGDELVNYSIPVSSKNIVVHDEQKNGVFYIVCHGRVRLLGFDVDQQRQVSVGMLEAGETFGGENLFCNQPLLTRALGASAGQVAWIPIAHLKQWLEQMPNLHTLLHQQTIERQCLTFFKTSTELHWLKSHRLRQLLPYLVETKIHSGSSLVQATPPGIGRYWLGSGLIKSRLGSSVPPIVGQSWGYLDLTVVDGIAQTDLLVYHLPRENWDKAQAVIWGLDVTCGLTASKSTPASPLNI